MARKSIRHMYNVPVILKFRRGRCLPVNAWSLTGMLQEIHSWVVFFCFFCFTVLSPVFVCSRLFLWRRRAVRAYARLAAAFLSNLSNPRRPHVQTFCVQIITTVYTLNYPPTNYCSIKQKGHMKRHWTNPATPQNWGLKKANKQKRKTDPGRQFFITHLTPLQWKQNLVTNFYYL